MFRWHKLLKALKANGLNVPSGFNNFVDWVVDGAKITEAFVEHVGGMDNAQKIVDNYLKTH